MLNRINELLLYAPKETDILKDLADVYEGALDKGHDKDHEKVIRSNDTLKKAARELIRFSDYYGIGGDLWQNYLTYRILSDENTFTISHERRQEYKDSLVPIAKRELCIFKDLFHYDFEDLKEFECGSIFRELRSFEMPLHGEITSKNVVGEKIREIAEELSAAGSGDAFCEKVFDFYKEFGTGNYALNRTFTIDEDENGSLKMMPTYSSHIITLDELIGYERQKAELIKNTEAFIEGRPANNVLLYGDSGSGKSTSIQAIINRYYHKGLRLIELHKEQFKVLKGLINRIKERNYKFIIFIDDLSFEEHETEYKYLKAVIEGGALSRPENVLIYATSNRRHLVKESFSDRNDMEFENDLHHSDTVEEKLSLASRFGVTIHYPSPNRREYHQIVKALANNAGIDIPEDELLIKADAWEIRHGGPTGRTARQFIDYLS